MLEQLTQRISQMTNQVGAGIYEDDVARYFGVHPTVVESDPSYVEEYQRIMAQKAQSRKRKGKSKGIMSRLFGKSSKTAKKGKVGSVRSVRSSRSRVGPSALDKLEYESPLSSPKSARKSMRGKGKRKTRHRRRKSRRSVRSTRRSKRR